jgi:small GTP-binding protein
MGEMDRISKKIILAGDVGVGKTSLIRRYVHSIFSEEYRATLGFKVDKKNVEVDGRIVSLLIWDVAGETNMIDIFYAHYKSSDGIIYVFDITRPPSSEKILGDIRVLNKFLKNVPMIVVANKIDLVQDAEKAKSEIGIEVDYFTSAKTGEAVEEIFTRIAKKCIS